MKIWSKFFLWPMLCFIGMSAFFTFFEVQSSTESFLRISAIIIQFLSFIIVPFTMLRLAPKHPYISTISYMIALWLLIYIVRNYWNHESFLQQGLSFIWAGVFWTVSAISIYFFYFDTQFQPYQTKTTSRSSQINISNDQSSKTHAN